jgi:cysteine-rich repeat protein
MKSAAAALVALIALASGCDAFDPELYQQAERNATALDSCNEDLVPVMVSSAKLIKLDLGDFDNSWQVPNCAIGRADGNDAFFAVDMTEGQKFHFHVNAIDAIDPVLYVVDGCDERVCQPLNAASRCGTNKEHLSFLATHSGRYYVGVDSADPGGGKVELLVLSPECGDGEKQHSEACDDGNHDALDGCDPGCRIEIPASDRNEEEPNDDFGAANLLAMGAPPSRFLVHGMLAGACDLETFTFTAPQDAVVSAQVLDVQGMPCAARPELTLDLQLFQGLTQIAQGKSVPANACPTLEAQPMQAGDSRALPWDGATYHLRLSGTGSESAMPFAFTLAIDLQPR